MPKDVQFGDVLTCHETGKQFVAAPDGCSTNYARDAQGNIYSDEGIAIMDLRDLLDRSKPFTCYISSNGKHVTGWKGNVLGTVVSSSRVKLTRWSALHGKTILAIRVRDLHGGFWYGRGSEGMSVTLRPSKAT